MNKILKDTPLKEADYTDTIYGLDYLRSEFHCLYLNAFKEAALENMAPDASVYTSDEKPCNLLNFMTRGRPLVLNFGSST